MERTNFETKKTLTGTILKMQPGDSLVVKNRDFKTTYVKTVCSRLRKRGYNLAMTEVGYPDGCRVDML